MYCELHSSSAFSFLDGASLPEMLVDRAAELGYPALALLDRDGVYGIPRFHLAAKRVGLKAIVGAELTMTLAPRGSEPGGGAAGPGSLSGEPRRFTLPVLVASREGYRNLCRLVTRMKLRAPKGEGALTLDDLDGNVGGLVALAGRTAINASRYGVGGLVDRIVGIFGAGNVCIELQRHLLRDEEADNHALRDLAAAFHLPLVATNGVRFAEPADRPLYDVLTCIRHKTTLARAGRRLSCNAERFLKSPDAMARLFSDLPDALAGVRDLTERLEYTMADLGYRFPDYPVPLGETMSSFLRKIAQSGARERYRPYHDRARRQIERELDLIEKLDLAGYFLIVWDIVNYCRQEDILVQGRGSAANSAVCYSLGITAVDPVGMDLLFERFLSEERGEWPDIDIDLPSGDRRERVIQHVYQKYGKLGAAMTANVITYRGRSAAREVGKALSLDPVQVDRLAKIMNHFEWVDPKETLARNLRDVGIDYEHPGIQLFGDLWQRIQDLPRHLGQHSGGMVICKGRLDEVVPLENASMPDRVVIQWDKDDCADMGLIKVDLLGLGMMAVLQDALHLVNTSGVGAPAAAAEGESASPEAAASGGGAPRAQKMMAVLQDALHLVNTSGVGAPAAGVESESSSLEAPASGGGAPRAQKMMAVLQDALHLVIANRDSGLGARDSEEQGRDSGLGARGSGTEERDSEIVTPESDLSLRPAEPRTPSPEPRASSSITQCARGPTFSNSGGDPTPAAVATHHGASQRLRAVARDDLAPSRLGRAAGAADTTPVPISASAQHDPISEPRAPNAEYRAPIVDLAHLPPGDPAVYKMLREADTVGIFQVESRAQMATLPRLRPVCFYDIVVEVAIIRPGPIVGQMVHPYLKRRQGVEPVSYPHPSLEPILARTLGVPLFQEQLLRMAMVAAGFTGGEAEELRRAFGFKRSEKRMQQIETKLRAGMARQGITGDAAEGIIRSITSFALYGFPESHAASFALLVYASAYLKAHYPAAFYTAMLNNQPMGFYHPATLVKDAQRHGVSFTPIDVQASDWECRVDPDGRVRLGLMYVNGLREEIGRRIADPTSEGLGQHSSALAGPHPRSLGSSRFARSPGRSRCPKCGCDDPSMLEETPNQTRFCNICAHEWGEIATPPSQDPGPRYQSIDDLIAKTGLRRDELATLADIGALNAFGHDRRTALWQIERASRPAGELFEEVDAAAVIPAAGSGSPLRPMTPIERVTADYDGMSLTIGPHPMALRRAELALRGVLRARDLSGGRHGRRVRVAGAVITRQRPGTAKGFVFLTLEDETGIANIIVRPDLFTEQRTAIIGAPYLLVEGTLQIQEGVTSIKAERVVPLAGGSPEPQSHDFR